MRRKPKSKKRRAVIQKVGEEGDLKLPWVVPMYPTSGVPEDAFGVAVFRMLQVLRPGRKAATIVAHDLPDPADLGDFDGYQGLAFIPNVITWAFQLYPTKETPPTWAGTYTEITAELTTNVQAQVRPVNSQNGATGTTVLSSTTGMS